MNPREQNIFRWPQLPPLPPPNEPVLICASTPPSRRTACAELRNILREALADWSGLLPEELPLLETSRGPVWQGRLAGHPLGISLSYCGGEGWIGLFRGGEIGIDAMTAESIPEAEEVARHYLGPTAWLEIQQSQNPARAFALAWTNLEARLKCLKRELTEWTTERDAAFRILSAQTVFPDGTVVTVAVDLIAGKNRSASRDSAVYSAAVSSMSRV